MWDNDTELDIQNNRIDRHATGSIVYLEKLYRSKFCLCPHGPVGSSRIADSIHYGCVPGKLHLHDFCCSLITHLFCEFNLLSSNRNSCPLSAVIMSNYYDLPFNEILDWRKFSVVVKESDLYQLKDILRNISQKDFVTLNQNLVKVISFSFWFLKISVS